MQQAESAGAPPLSGGVHWFLCSLKLRHRLCEEHSRMLLLVLAVHIRVRMSGSRKEGLFPETKLHILSVWDGFKIGNQKILFGNQRGFFGNQALFGNQKHLRPGRRYES